VGTLSSVVNLGETDPAYEPTEEIAAVLQQAELALASARGLGDPAAIAAALVGVARLRFRLGQYEAARGLGREALSTAAPHSPAAVDAWQVLGNCAAETSSLAEAESCYRAAGELARELGYHRGRAAALHGLAAGVYLPRGQFELVLAAGEEARRMAASQGRQDWLVFPLTTTSMVYQLTAERVGAQAALDELARLASPDSLLQGYHLCTSANLAVDEGKLEEARASYARARSIAEASGEPWLNVAVRLGLSRYHRGVGDGPNARMWADDALVFARRVGYRHEEGKALIERGRAAWLCSNDASAEADLRAAVEILEQLGAAFDLARARFLLAAMLYGQGHPDAVAAWLAAARAIVEGGYAFLLEQERALAFPLLAAHQRSSDAILAGSCAALLEQLERVAPPALRIYTLGRWEVWQGSRSLQLRALRQRRAGELLALLLLAPGRRLSCDQVAEALFPGKGPAAAQILFHHATSALRRALEPDLPEKFPSRYLAVEEGQATLHLPPGSWVDLEQFEAHYRRGEWQAALELYGGELLPNYRYAEWAAAPRERLALLFQRALFASAQGCFAEGRFGETLDACQHLLALEPWHEEAVLLGMRACVALHDRAGARRLYLTLAKTLQKELDTVPQAELQELYRSLTPSTFKNRTQ
jgi:DNA-binding SARP family transcriptional activator